MSFGTTSAAPQERFARERSVLLGAAAIARADRIDLENPKFVTQGYGLLGVGLAAPELIITHTPSYVPRRRVAEPPFLRVHNNTHPFVVPAVQMTPPGGAWQKFISGG